MCFWVSKFLICVRIQSTYFTPFQFSNNNIFVSFPVKIISPGLDRLVFQMATWSINQYFQTVSILFIDQHSAISFFVCGIDHHTA